jgi:hypothetical protein
MYKNLCSENTLQNHEGSEEEKLMVFVMSTMPQYVDVLDGKKSPNRIIKHPSHQKALNE